MRQVQFVVARGGNDGHARQGANIASSRDDFSVAIRHADHDVIHVEQAGRGIVAGADLVILATPYRLEHFLNASLVGQGHVHQVAKGPQRQVLCRDVVAGESPGHAGFQQDGGVFYAQAVIRRIVVQVFSISGDREFRAVAEVHFAGLAVRVRQELIEIGFPASDCIVVLEIALHLSSPVRDSEYLLLVLP